MNNRQLMFRAWDGHQLLDSESSWLDDFFIMPDGSIYQKYSMPGWDQCDIKL